MVDIPNKLTAWLTINRACNLRCKWCYAQGTGFNPEDSMSPEVLSSSLDLFSGLGLQAVILIGGEPTIHPRFLEIVQEIRKRGMDAYVVTNAISFANPKFLDKAIEAGIGSITVSLKASNPEDFKASTGKDSFKKTMRAIRNIADRGVSHVVNVTVCESVAEHFDEMIEVVKQSGATAFSIDTGKPILDHDRAVSSDGMETPEQMAGFFTEVYPKLIASCLRFSVKVAIPFCLFERSFINQLIADGNIMTGCQMTQGKGIIVAPNGDIIPCNHMCDNPIARLGSDFDDASSFRTFRSKPQTVQFYDAVSAAPAERCVSCSYWHMCGAGCRLYWLQYGPEVMFNQIMERR